MEEMNKCVNKLFPVQILLPKEIEILIFSFLTPRKTSMISKKYYKNFNTLRLKAIFKLQKFITLIKISCYWCQYRDYKYNMGLCEERITCRSCMMDRCPGCGFMSEGSLCDFCRYRYF